MAGEGEATPFEGLGEETQGFLTNKNIDSVEKLVNSYQESEKFIGKMNGGKGMDRFAELPDWDNPESSAAFFSKIGKPETSKDYQGIDVAENSVLDASRVEWFRDAAHKHNLTSAQAKGIWDEFQSDVNGQYTEITTTQEQENTLALAKLKDSWGESFDDRAAANGLAVSQLSEKLTARGVEGGLTGEMISGIESVIGLQATMELFNVIAESVMEPPAPFDPSNIPSGPGSFGQTKGQVLDQIDQLKFSPEAKEALANHNSHQAKAFKEKWNRMHQMLDSF